MKLVNIGMNRTCLFLFANGAATLEDLQIDEAEGHEAESEPGHDSGEEDEEARDPGVDEPPRRSEHNTAKAHRVRLWVPSQHLSHNNDIDQVGLLISLWVSLGLLGFVGEEEFQFKISMTENESNKLNFKEQNRVY